MPDLRRGGAPRGKNGATPHPMETSYAYIAMPLIEGNAMSCRATADGPPSVPRTAVNVENFLSTDYFHAIRVPVLRDKRIFRVVTVGGAPAALASAAA